MSAKECSRSPFSLPTACAMRLRANRGKITNVASLRYKMGHNVRAAGAFRGDWGTIKAKRIRCFCAAPLAPSTPVLRVHFSDLGF